MSNIKRKIIALILAVILSLGIIGAVIGISKLTKPKQSLPPLQMAAQDYGTINLDCTYNDEAHTLAVTQKTTYINHSNKDLREVKFYIYGNAYQKDAQYPAIAKNEISRAYPNGFDAGYVKVTTPHIKYSGNDNTIITVPLTTTLAPKQSTTITLEYILKIPNVKHRFGYTDASVNLGNFYAIPVVYNSDWQIYPYSSNGDPFYNEPYNFDVTLHLPEGYRAATSGESVGNNHYRGYVLRDFAMVLSRHFKTLSRKVGNTTVNYYYLDDPIPEISLHTAANALAYFSNEFLNYPYSTLAVVETDFLHGGMEYGALVYIANDVTDQQQYQTVIVHEIAHQWWYGIVGNNQNRSAWIDEGLAEYSTAVFFETHPQYGKTLKSIATENQHSIKVFEDIMDEYHVPYSRVMNKALVNYKLASEYTINAYARAMLLFYNITEMVGYQNLNHALATFAQENTFTFGTEYRLIATLERCLGRDLDKYINNYLAGNQEIML